MARTSHHARRRTSPRCMTNSHPVRQETRCQTRRKRYHVAKLMGGKSAKPHTALLWTIITSVVIVGLIIVFPLAFALPGMHLLTLSRWQFAISVCFHILFPS